MKQSPLNVFIVLVLVVFTIRYVNKVGILEPVTVEDVMKYAPCHIGEIANQWRIFKIGKAWAYTDHQGGAWIVDGIAEAEYNVSILTALDMEKFRDI